MNKNKPNIVLLLLVILTLVSCKALAQENNTQNLYINNSQVFKQAFPQSKLDSNTKSKITKSTLTLLKEYKTYSDFLDLEGKIAVKTSIDEKPTIKRNKVARCEIYKARVSFYEITKKNKIVKQITNSEYGQIYCKTATHLSKSVAIPQPIEYSPDGKLLALKISSGFMEDNIHIYEVSSLKQIHKLSYKDFEDNFTVIRKQKVEDDTFSIADTSIDFSAFSPDGKLFAVASEATLDKGAIRVWDVATGKMVFFAPFGKEYQKYKDENFLLPFIFSSDKKYLHWFGGISWDIATGEELSKKQTKDIFKNKIDCQLFSSNRLLGVKNRDGVIEIVNLSNGEVKCHFDSNLYFEKDETIVKINQGGTILITTTQSQLNSSTTLSVKVRHWQIK